MKMTLPKLKEIIRETVREESQLKEKTSLKEFVSISVYGNKEYENWFESKYKNPDYYLSKIKSNGTKSNVTLKILKLLYGYSGYRINNSNNEIVIYYKDTPIAGVRIYDDALGDSGDYIYQVTYLTPELQKNKSLWRTVEGDTADLFMYFNRAKIGPQAKIGK